MRLMIAICMLAAVGAAQTMVESAILTGASAAAGAKAKGTGDSISKIFGKVNGTLAGAAARGTAPASSVAAAESAASAAPAEPKLPKPSKADFEGVEKGMPRADLIAKVGKPASALSMTEEGRLEETLRFHTKEGSSARVKVTDGKISSIEWWPAQ
jgi:hypothetical protein